MANSKKTKRQLILEAISDLACDFMYYDRKEDSELENGDIETAIEKGEITVKEILDHFSSECGFDNLSTKSNT